MYFGFTFCPDICPNELVKIGKIFDKLEKNSAVQGKVTPVFVSIDPARDTVAQMAQYARDFHPKMVWLTGTSQQLKDVAKKFRVYWSKVDETEEDDEDYSVDHSIILYLMGPDGEFMELYTQSVDASDVVKRITRAVVDNEAQ